MPRSLAMKAIALKSTEKKSIDESMSFPSVKKPSWAGLLWALILIVSAAVLYCPPHLAANLDILPDSVEYAVGAQRFATLGHFNIALNGVVHPSRYPPWFPVLILSPLYRLFPSEIGIGIWAVFASDLLAVASAYAIGRRLAAEWGGVAAALALLVFLHYSWVSREIMSDIPFMSAGLAGAWLFLSMVPAPTRRQWILAALIPALAFAIRPVGAAVLLPFLLLALRRLPLPRAIGLAILLCLPTALLILGTAVYDQQTFGHWSRTGYHYWDPQDYEFLGLTFSPRYLHTNLAVLTAHRTLPTWILALAGGIVLWRKKTLALRPLLSYIALAALPITVFHLFYFCTGLRFHYLLLGLATCLGAAGLAALVPAPRQNRGWLLAALLIVGVVCAHHRIGPTPGRSQMAADIAHGTSANAVVITELDPVYAWAEDGRDSQRQIIPVDRTIAYATNIIAPNPMRVSMKFPPRDWMTNMAHDEALFGWQEAVPWTAQEHVERIRRDVQRGVPVYLSLPIGDWRWSIWSRQFHLEPVNSTVSRLFLQQSTAINRASKSVSK
jgi:4-amino-4-deoxy-L-arabinose transferase-like glycosyltransferase